MIIDDTQVTAENLPDLDEEEAARYVEYVREKTGRPVTELVVADAGEGNVTLRYELQTEKFERIRRITGYLVGTIDRWNDAKRFEERERVKHAG